jgi:hypothetical protein
MTYTRQEAYSILDNGCPWHRILCLGRLKQKSDKNKTEFCLIKSLSSNASYAQEESVEDLLLLCPSRTDIIGCADRTSSSQHSAI